MRITILFSVFLGLLTGCHQNKQESQSAFSPIVLGEPNVDSSSIVGLYKYIFSTKCGVNGCHDGTFEPDFTTIESAYYTLVYHPINKNNLSRSYKYRVVPFDTAHSVLYARISNCCFVNKGDQMPQLSETDKLTSEQINCVSKWILNGAKNIDGKTMILPPS